MPDPRVESLDLLGLARKGDRQAMGELLDRHRGQLLERVRLMMGPAARRVAESADFVQGALTDALLEQDRIEIRDETRLLRWLTTVARNNIRQSLRKRRERAFESLSDSCGGAGEDRNKVASPPSEADRQDKLFRLAEVLEELDEDHRRVIELRTLQEQTFVEIARAIGRSESGARLLFERAVVRLGQGLGA